MVTKLTVSTKCVNNNNATYFDADIYLNGHFRTNTRNTYEYKDQDKVRTNFYFLIAAFKKYYYSAIA